MKLNKKIVAINLLASFMFAQNVYAARFESDAVTPGSSSNGGDISVPKVEGSEGTIGEAQPPIICPSDINTQTNMPLGLINRLVRNGKPVTVEVDEAKKVVKVNIPPILNSCGTVQVETRQGTDSKNMIILFRIDGTKKVAKKDDAGNVVKDAEGKEVMVDEVVKGITYGEFEACLNKKIKNGKIPHKDIPGKEYAEAEYKFPYSFNKDEDSKKSISVSYGYPKAFDAEDGFPPFYGKDRGTTFKGYECMIPEKSGRDTVYLHKGFDALIEDINKACSSGDAQKIADMRRTIGNAEVLQDNMDLIKSALDAHYLIAAKAEATAIYKKMSAIETKMNKERDSMDETEARKRSAEYAALAKELDETFLNPAIYRIETLMAKRETLDSDSPEIAKIDDEIRKLNTEIREFYGKGDKAFSALYSIMEKYALNDSAKTIDDIRLKSYAYSRVFAGKPDKRGKPLTMAAANKMQVEGMKRFDKTLDDWGDQYQVSQGSTYPIKKTEKERQGAINKMNSRWAAYEKKEYSDYNSYCATGWTGSVKNPVKCKSFMSGREKRMNAELKKREKDLLYIKGRNDKLERMGTNYNDYQRKMASIEEEEEYDDYGASYSSYEDNFEERYPSYSGPTTGTGYDANLYGMDGTSAMMGYGQQQQQMYNPYQQSQMYGAQPGYQYQMPQMQQQQMGGWPSIR